ncbi:Uncharacterised protein [Chlamydia trachomatis]|nr:Uncharacterised protein [Chlamydia trachomatis]
MLRPTRPHIPFVEVWPPSLDTRAVESHGGIRAIRPPVSGETSHRIHPAYPPIRLDCHIPPGCVIGQAPRIGRSHAKQSPPQTAVPLNGKRNLDPEHRDTEHENATARHQSPSRLRGPVCGCRTEPC